VVQRRDLHEIGASGGDEMDGDGLHDDSGFF
jgi:hypothetical protein